MIYNILQQLYITYIVHFFLDILSSEHLTTKRQIESVREMFGEDNWLHSHAGSYVQDILGIKQQPEHESFSEENAVNN